MLVPILLAISIIARLASAGACNGTYCNNTYNLRKTYNATNFFSAFDFQDSYDIWTKGYARYVSQEEATNLGLAKIENDSVYLGVDSETILDPHSEGRKSVRLESKVTFDEGLLVADFAHLPANTCGMWPAFWLLRDDEMYSEIDIIENVSLQDFNEITMYTKSTPCDMQPDEENMSGNLRHGNCYWNARPKRESGLFRGCGATAAEGTFGDDFNQKGGGVWAPLIDDSGVKVWHFDPDDVPGDIGQGNPNPEGWGAKPVMNFAATNCNVKAAWQKMKIIINTTFCGEYAGNRAWGGFTGCQQQTGHETCHQYVAGNPAAFKDVYFLINSVKVFQKN